MCMILSAALSDLPCSAPVEGVWRLGIGDPTPLGWLTAAGYVAGSGLCLVAALRTRQFAPRLPKAMVRPVFWAVLAALLFALGINKQLDLHIWFTDVAKQLALAQGWYPRRRAVQIGFVVAVGVAGTAIGCWAVRGAYREHVLATVGMNFLLCFVLIRAASLHDVDRVITTGLGSVRLYHLLEIAGIVCVASGAWRRARYIGKAAPAGSGGRPPSAEGRPRAF